MVGTALFIAGAWGAKYGYNVLFSLCRGAMWCCDRWLPLVIFSISIALKAIVAWFSINFHPHFKNRLYNNLGVLIYFAVENPDFSIQNESLCSKRREPNLSRGTEIKATQKPKFWYWYLGIGDWL